MCSRCTSLEEQVDRLTREREFAEQEKRTYAHRWADLKAELTNPEQDGPATEEEKALHALWQELCHHEKAALGPSRLPALRRALRSSWGGHEKVERAIRGVAKFPFMVDGKRRSHGKAKDRYDDLELIVRNERNLERFAALADDEPEKVQPLHSIPEDDLRSIYLRLPGAVDEDGKLTAYCMECSLKQRTGASTLKDGVLSCNLGCTHDEQERAIREWWAESGMATCPTCGGDGPRLRHALLKRAAA
jgi:hypothetical protein